jgi:hypothetical protein
VATADDHLDGEHPKGVAMRAKDNKKVQEKTNREHCRKADYADERLEDEAQYLV